MPALSYRDAVEHVCIAAAVGVAEKLAAVWVEEAVGGAGFQADAVDDQVRGGDVHVRPRLVGAHDVAAVALVGAVRTVVPLVAHQAERLAARVRTAGQPVRQRVALRLAALQTGGPPLGAVEQVAAARGGHEVLPVLRPQLHKQRAALSAPQAAAGAGTVLCVGTGWSGAGSDEVRSEGSEVRSGEVRGQRGQRSGQTRSGVRSQVRGVRGQVRRGQESEGSEVRSEGLEVRSDELRGQRGQRSGQRGQRSGQTRSGDGDTALLWRLEQ